MSLPTGLHRGVTYVINNLKPTVALKCKTQKQKLLALRCRCNIQKQKRVVLRCNTQIQKENAKTLPWSANTTYKKRGAALRCKTWTNKNEQPWGADATYKNKTEWSRSAKHEQTKTSSPEVQMRHTITELLHQLRHQLWQRAWWVGELGASDCCLIR